MSYTVTLRPSGTTFMANENESLVEAASRQHIALPYGCLSGNCRACEAPLLQGTVAVAGESLNAGQSILTCSSVCQSDIELQLDAVAQVAHLEVKTLPAKVNRIDKVADDVCILQLRLPPNTDFKFLPGQFIDILFKPDVQRSYSLANMNAENNQLELHIRHKADGVFTEFVFNDLKLNQLLRFEGPKGTFFVRSNNKPLLFLAGGTGFAPVKSMVEALLAESDPREIYIYWGVNTIQGLYSELPATWSKHMPHVHYVPVVLQDDNWNGRAGFVHQAVLDDFDSLSHFDAYACGSPAMVDAAQQSFTAKGLPANAFFSDAFV